MDTRVPHYLIENTSFCPSGLAPRWTWWLRGIARTQRYGIVGTDEQGRGLYLFRADGDRSPERELLVDPAAFEVPADSREADACRMLAAALEALGWGSPMARTRGAQ